MGVNRGPDTYKKPIPASTIHKFFGSECTDDVVNDQAMKANLEAFFVSGADDLPEREPARQTLDNAANIFHGVEETKKGLQLGAPIPGYSGHNRRIEADNIFGATYQAAKTGANTSNNRIDFEKGETLKQTCKFMPSYSDARHGRQM